MCAIAKQAAAQQTFALHAPLTSKPPAKQALGAVAPVCESSSEKTQKSKPPAKAGTGRGSAGLRVSSEENAEKQTACEAGTGRDSAGLRVFK